NPNSMATTNEAPDTVTIADGISKRVVSAAPDSGSASSPPSYPTESHFAFDFVVRVAATGAVLDDSRLHPKRPVSLYSGRGFQIGFWETCLETMRPGEVSEFAVEPEQLGLFPVQYRKLRDYLLDRKSAHCCGMAGVRDGGGLGYADLDDLLAKPQRLLFEFHLREAKLPHEFRKEAWIMRPEEKRAALPQLRQEGNDLYKAGKTADAAARYTEALAMLEDLAAMERPQDTKWLELDKAKVPFLLNLAQCQLLLGDNYQTIRLCTEALSREPDNVKAVYRRAKAHAAVWDVAEAKQDFSRAAQLDPGLAAACDAAVRDLTDKVRERERLEKEQLRGKLIAGE
ncbi:hypothetical protein BOX15_Mlig021722g1, partial [Macrostomum lignano]